MTRPLHNCRPPRRLLGTLIAVAVMFFGAGCTPLGYQQMTRVSKDWCLSIRANQMIPVYPLTEDLQPGDVFLVQRSVQEQQSDYIAKGFLPLDDHRHRISLATGGGAPPAFSGITRLYFDGYFKDSFGTDLPHARPGTNAAAGAIPGQPMPLFNEIVAPRTAFPSYTFDVQRGGSLSVAVPVHGISVGLNYMQADHATCTLTLLDGHTFAADTYFLDSALRTWAHDDAIAASLRDARTANAGKPVYLRVVTRVYLVGGIAASLTRTDSKGATGTVGNVAPVTPVRADAATNADNYNKVLNALSAQVNAVAPATTNPSPAPTSQPAAAAQPTTGSSTGASSLATLIPKLGGAVQFTEASSLGVSLNEVFDHPLVIGYLGFDVAVLPDGSLGPRVPTFDVLEQRRTPTDVRVAAVSDPQLRNATLHAAYTSLSSRPNGVALQLQLIRRVGEVLPEFASFSASAAALLKEDKATPASTQGAKVLSKKFEDSWDSFVSKDVDAGPRYDAFFDAFDKAFSGQ